MTRHTCSGDARRIATAVPPWAVSLAPGGSSSVTTTSPAARRRRTSSDIADVGADIGADDAAASSDTASTTVDISRTTSRRYPGEATLDPPADPGGVRRAAAALRHQ